MEDNYFNDLLNQFGFNASNTGTQPKRTYAQELDDLWQDYIDFVNELKNDGYKVLRSENGKHKVVKRE